MKLNALECTLVARKHKPVSHKCFCKSSSLLGAVLKATLALCWVAGEGFIASVMSAAYWTL